MKKLFGFIILLVAAGGGAYYYFVYNKVEEKPQILSQAISQGDVVEAVVATGTLGPVRTIEVGSQVSGVVQNLLKDFNDLVRPGEVIAQIDPTLLQTQVAIQEANIDQRKLDIENQKIQLDDVRMQLKRTEELHVKGLVNERDLEQAKLAVLNRQAQIGSAEKQLVSANANLAQAKLNVEYTTIKAPTEGIAPNQTFVVVQRHVDIGQTVQSSTTTPQFFTLATDIRTLKLTAGVDEAEIGKVRAGQDVVFTVDTYGTQEFLGKVNSVRLNASTNNNVVTYPVWIDVPNPDLKLRPSLTANARIIVSTANDTLRVPNQALRFRPNTDTYVALGLEPPAPGQGGAGRGRANGAAAGNDDPQTPGAGRAAQPAGAPAAGDAGAGRAGAAQAGQGNQGRAGTGQGAVDPNALQQVAERFGGRSGRGGRGGRGGSNRTGGGRGANAVAANTGPQTELRGTKIDENFAELQRTIRAEQVYTWTEATKELKAINIRTGISDGTFTEIISGDVEPGLQVITGIVLPASMVRSNPSQQNSIFNQQGGRGGDRGFGGGGRGGGGGGRGGGGRD
jgi:HlyD family secretion protein